VGAPNAMKVYFRNRDDQGTIHGNWIDRITLIGNKPEFFEDQKPFLNSNFVKTFQEMLD